MSMKSDTLVVVQLYANSVVHPRFLDYAKSEFNRLLRDLYQDQISSDAEFDALRDEFADEFIRLSMEWLDNDKIRNASDIKKEKHLGRCWKNFLYNSKFDIKNMFDRFIDT